MREHEDFRLAPPSSDAAEAEPAPERKSAGLVRILREHPAFVLVVICFSVTSYLLGAYKDVIALTTDRDRADTLAGVDRDPEVRISFSGPKCLFENQDARPLKAVALEHHSVTANIAEEKAVWGGSRNFEEGEITIQSLKFRERVSGTIPARVMSSPCAGGYRRAFNKTANSSDLWHFVECKVIHHRAADNRRYVLSAYLVAHGEGENCKFTSLETHRSSRVLVGGEDVQFFWKDRKMKRAFEIAMQRRAFSQEFNRADRVLLNTTRTVVE